MFLSDNDEYQRENIFCVFLVVYDVKTLCYYKGVYEIIRIVPRLSRKIVSNKIQKVNC